ncbi:MAG: hypothetical protein HZC37_21565 [Burkholderiales bacterium]|nr:hypothetical protein [Burkholderiales bacterium]
MPSPTHREPARRGPVAWFGQVLLYGLFALAIGVFSQWPRYRHLGADEALVKVSFTRVGKPVGECRTLGAEELAKLPPNMRQATVCPRERSPVTVEVDLDGRTVLSRAAQPGGVARDGASALYERLVVPAGEHRFAVRLSDDARARQAPYQREATVRLVPGQVLVIDFDAARGGITMN